MTRLILDIHESFDHPGHCSVNAFTIDDVMDPPTEAEAATLARFKAVIGGLMEQMLRELTAEGLPRCAIVEKTFPKTGP